MNDFTKEECICKDIKIPRWDIYICSYCGRQLAFLTTPELPYHLIPFWKKLFIKIKGFIRNE
jgi:hypothetical protein